MWNCSCAMQSKSEQDTAIDMEISDGPPGGTVEVNQFIELDQDVHVQIDIRTNLKSVI